MIRSQQKSVSSIIMGDVKKRMMNADFFTQKFAENLSNLVPKMTILKDARANVTSITQSHVGIL